MSFIFTFYLCTSHDENAVNGAPRKDTSIYVLPIVRIFGSTLIRNGQCDCALCSAGPGCGTEDLHRHPSSPPLRSPSLSPPRSPSSQSFPWFLTTSLPRAISKLKGWTLGLHLICFMSTWTQPKAVKCVQLARFPICSVLYFSESTTTRHGRSICI